MRELYKTFHKDEGKLIYFLKKVLKMVSDRWKVYDDKFLLNKVNGIQIKKTTQEVNKYGYS